MTAKVLALTGAAALLASPALANETFKDWWVTCDNTRQCAAFGFAGEAYEMSGYLKVARGAGAADEPAARIVMDGKAGPWSLAIDGRALASVTARLPGGMLTGLPPSSRSRCPSGETSSPSAFGAKAPARVRAGPAGVST